MSHPILVQGACQPLGRRVAEALTRAGLPPVLAGRDGEALQELARQLEVPCRVQPPGDAHLLDACLADVELVVNCREGSRSDALLLAESALRARCHYVDMCDAWPVVERVVGLADGVRAHGRTFVMGAGLEGLLGDALAARLARLLPAGDHLELAFSLPGGLSPGTARTLTDSARNANALRSCGHVKSMPPGTPRREIDLGHGAQPCVAVPGVAVATAHHGLQCQHVVVYATLGAATRLALRLQRHGGWLLGTRPLRQLLRRGRRADGLERGVVWGELRDPAGRSVAGHIQLTDGADPSVPAVVDVVRRVLDDQLPRGVLTAAQAGAETLVERLDDVVLHAEPAPAGSPAVRRAVVGPGADEPPANGSARQRAPRPPQLSARTAPDLEAFRQTAVPMVRTRPAGAADEDASAAP